MKRAIKGIITGSRLLLRLLDGFGRDLPRVIVYHRFAPPGARIPHRVSADELAWQLDTICRDFRVISLAECIEYYTRYGTWPKQSVVLTIDDGYRDMYEWAYPELLKRKLTATFFVTTRFVDGDIWLWPDRLDYAIGKTTRKVVSIATKDAGFNLPLQNDQQKALVWKGFSDHCISVSNNEREEFIMKVEAALEVCPPTSPPPEYSALTWDELCEMHHNGIEIGSHTMNHPILSRIAPDLLDNEITNSKMVIEEHLGSAIKSFCYPNSAPEDINDLVVSAVRKAGFTGAVFGSDLASWEPYRVPRMGVTDDRNDFLWKVYSGEFLSLTTARLISENHRISL